MSDLSKMSNHLNGGAAGMTINKKQISKEHAINHPVRFDASPFKLKVEMKVVLRDLKLKNVT